MGPFTRGLVLPAVAVVGSVTGASTVGLLIQTVLFLLLGVTWAIIAVTAAAIVTRLAPAAIRGEALGTYAAVSAGAGSLGRLLGGAVAAVSFLLVFTVAGSFVLLGAQLIYRLRTLVDTPDAPLQRVVSEGQSPPALIALLCTGQDDGLLGGRGSISAVEAAEYLIRIGYQPEQTVYLLDNHDEETGGHRDAARVAKQFEKRGRRLDFVVDEGMPVANETIPNVESPLAMIGEGRGGSQSFHRISREP